MHSVFLALAATLTYPTVNGHELILPLENVSSINADFDQRRGYKRTHGAIDQNVRIGTAVRAVAAGEVTNVYSMFSYMRETNRILKKIRRSRTTSWRLAKNRMRQCNCTWRIRRKSRGAWKSGVYITVEHISDKGKIFKSQYMHLSKVYVKIGSKVKQGDVIAKSGDTAIIDSNPHLHFQIKYKGIKQNPKRYIRQLDGKITTILKKFYNKFFRFLSPTYSTLHWR